MGKKKISKAPKTPKKQVEEKQVSEKEKSPEPTPKPTKDKKGAKSKPASSEKTKFFSDSFTDRVDQFKTFYESFLSVRGDADPAQELAQVIDRVSTKLEDACSQVLKEDLQDAENWITEEQMKIQKQIQATNSAQHSTREALTAAGTFSLAEINAQVDGIKIKGEKLKKTHDDFQELKVRAGDIYKQGSKMDEE